jgi:hypothetical protein
VKKPLIALLLLLPLTVEAFNKDFKILSDKIPLEFSLLFDSLKLEIKSPREKIQLIGLVQELDQNLGFLKKEHIFLLMKSEVIKNVLEHKFAKVRQFDMTNLLVERLEEDFKNKKKYLNPFSEWIWRSILAELKQRQATGLITDKSFNPNQFTGSQRQEAQRFKRYLNYLLPWIDRMDSLNAAQFNALSKEVSWEILQKINQHSSLFKRFASTASGDSRVTLFNIPQELLNLHPQEIKQMRNNQLPMTLKEQSLRERNEAKEKVENISPVDMSPVSDDVIQEIESKAE